VTRGYTTSSELKKTVERRAGRATKKKTDHEDVSPLNEGDWDHYGERSRGARRSKG